MVFIKPYLLVHGGNTGSEPQNDVWCLNLEKAPYTWAKLETGNEVKNIDIKYIYYYIRYLLLEYTIHPHYAKLVPQVV